MTSKVYSAAYVGFDGQLIEIECDTSNGLPSVVIVGLANKAVDEAKERIRSSLKNNELAMPRKRITLNLAPADVPKDGSSYDLPMAVAVLAASEQIKRDMLIDSMFVGELSLNGVLRPVKGVISHVEVAKKHGFKRIFMPIDNSQQATLVSGVDIISVTSLSELIRLLNKLETLKPVMHKKILPKTAKKLTDFNDIYGQQTAKRALEIAAAGHHNILMNGPPGAGKTMMAKALLSIMPRPHQDEIVEITKLHSLAGELTKEVCTERPFRSPHHTSSNIALIGGGKNPRPGEISLAHKGILFLDELPEYARSCLESLRQPLEDREITIARANETVRFPADFMLVATQNPCPCGYYQDPDHDCTCTPHQINQYSRKISGPLLDRIDLVVNVQKVAHKHLLGDTSNTPSSAEIAHKVAKAREIQKKRFDSPSKTNVHMTNTEIKNIAGLEKDAKEFLEMAAGKLSLSARSYIKIIRVSRTIADLEASSSITRNHISEALQYRHR